MQRWEYVMQREELDRLADPKVWDELGDEGWEMVGFHVGASEIMAIFKRPTQ